MSLESRIARLERHCPVEFTQPPPPPLAPYLIAFHVGEWKPHESPAEAYHRALGVFHFGSLDIDALNERHMAALRLMFADRGVDLDSEPWEQIDSMLGRLVDEAAKAGMRLPMECLTAQA
jgi:hypothetical protein